jgi:O-antigen ligase
MLETDFHNTEDDPGRVTVSALVALVPLVVSVIWLPLESGGSEPLPLLIAHATTFSAVGWLGLSGRLARPRDETKSLIAIIAVVVAAVLLSTIFSEDLDASIPALLGWFWLAGSATLAMYVTRDPRLRELLVALLAAAVLMQILWGYFAWWGGSDPFRAQVGTFYAANQYAGYVLLLAPVFLGICYGKERLSGAVAFGTLSAVGYLAVVFSGSRGGAVAAMLGLLGMTGLGSRLFGARVLVRFAVVSLIVVVTGWGLTSALVFPAPAESKEGLTSFQSQLDVGTSIGMRGRWAQGALLIGASKPFTGSGPGTFGDKFFQIQHPRWQWSKFTHNHYLESLAEGGALLLIGVVLLSVVPVVLGWGRLKGAVGPEQGWKLGLWGGLVGAGAHLAVDHDWSYPGFGVAFIIAAILVVHRPEKGAPFHNGQRWKRLVGAAAVAALLAMSGIAGSRALLSGAILSEVDTLSRAEMAASLAPHSTEPRVVASAALVRGDSQANLRRAIDHLRIAGSLDRLDPQIRWCQAEVLALLGEWDAARTAYREGLLIAPNAPEAYLLYAAFEIGRDNQRAAREILQLGISRFGGSDSSDSLRGLRPEALAENPCRFPGVHFFEKRAGLGDRYR